MRADATISLLEAARVLREHLEKKLGVGVDSVAIQSYGRPRTLINFVSPDTVEGASWTNETVHHRLWKESERE